MARPKKQRYYDGVTLVDNLYPDPKKRLGKWQYRRPDGSVKIFSADTVREANEIATQANLNVESFSLEKKSTAENQLTIIGSLVEDYLVYRERVSPDLRSARSWSNRVYALRQFGREFRLPPNRTKRQHILNWWDTLTNSQQKLRHAELRKAFNYWMGRGYFSHFDYNPFTTSDDRPRLYLKPMPTRTRLRLSINEFWAIYDKAKLLGYDSLMIAMSISLLTFLRQGDVLSLRFDRNIKDGCLRTVVGKSAAQRGHVQAVRLEWDLSSYPLLCNTIKKAKEISLRNMCSPYLVSYLSQRRRSSGALRFQDDRGRMTKERLTGQFRRARDETGIWASISDGKKPPSFHEIRALSDLMAKSAGFGLEDIQLAMAHGDVKITKMYLANHDELPFDRVGVALNESVLKRRF